MMGTYKASSRREAAKEWLVASMEDMAGAPCKIKLCGMSRPQDIDAVIDAHPDMVGFIVDFPKSHRSVTVEQLRELCALFDAGDNAEDGARLGNPHPIWRVGVFVDKPMSKVAEIVSSSGLDLVQLHGHEDTAYVDALRAELPDTGIIQAYRIRCEDDVKKAESSPADLILLDNGQGTGQRFDWSLIKGVTRPFLLAGGLDPQNVGDAIRQVHPWGVDISSGIEIGGVKDPAKIHAAVAAIRSVSAKREEQSI